MQHLPAGATRTRSSGGHAGRRYPSGESPPLHRHACGDTSHRERCFDTEPQEIFIKALSVRWRAGSTRWRSNGVCVATLLLTPPEGSTPLDSPESFGAGSTRGRSNGVCIVTLLLTPVAWGGCRTYRRPCANRDQVRPVGHVRQVGRQPAGAADKV